MSKHVRTVCLVESVLIVPILWRTLTVMASMTCLLWKPSTKSSAWLCGKSGTLLWAKPLDGIPQLSARRPTAWVPQAGSQPEIGFVADINRQREFELIVWDTTKFQPVRRLQLNYDAQAVTDFRLSSFPIADQNKDGVPDRLASRWIRREIEFESQLVILCGSTGDLIRQLDIESTKSRGQVYHTVARDLPQLGALAMIETNSSGVINQDTGNPVSYLRAISLTSGKTLWQRSGVDSRDDMQPFVAPQPGDTLKYELRFGSAVVVVDDHNGDGIPDVATTVQHVGRGRLIVVLSGANGSLLRTIDPAPQVLSTNDTPLVGIRLNGKTALVTSGRDPTTKKVQLLIITL